MLDRRDVVVAAMAVLRNVATIYYVVKWFPHDLAKPKP